MPSVNASDRPHVRLPKSTIAALKVCAAATGRTVCDYVVCAVRGAARGTVVIAPEGADTTGAAGGQTESLSLPPELASYSSDYLRRVILGAVATHQAAAVKREADLLPLERELAELRAVLVHD